MERYRAWQWHRLRVLAAVLVLVLVLVPAQSQPTTHHSLTRTHTSDTVVNPHPCFSDLFPEGLEAARFMDGEVLECEEADGTRHRLKVRMGTWDKDEATLECFALVSIAKDFNNFDNKRGNLHKSVFPIVVPQVFFHRGPATADEDSVCVTEFFTNPTITFNPFIRDVVRTQKCCTRQCKGF
jgi:hypothetical protein